MINRNWMLLSGAALGAGAMYFLDTRGNRRPGTRPVSSIDARRLQKRIEHELSRIVSYPGEIEVYVGADQRVCLVGRVVMDEADRAVMAIQGIRGVREVDDRLERHAVDAFVPLGLTSAH